MTSSNISSESQVRYMIQWFGEWSDLQRQDFLPILAEKMAANTAYVNGIVNSMGAVNCQDKPMNLFQCRVKLFNEWFSNWTTEERDKLIRCISEIDTEFGRKLQDEITGNKQVIDGEPEPSTAHAAAVENGVQENGGASQEEVENQEVVDDDPVVVSQLTLSDSSNVAIQITAE